MTNPPDDLTADWPADPNNEALQRFGEQLPAAIPQLPLEALERVEQDVQRELAFEQRRRGRTLLFRGALAASLLLMLGLGAYWWPQSEVPPEQPLRPIVQTKPAPVETGVRDRFTVEYAVPPSVPSSGASLLRLDEQESLFTN